MPPHYHNGAVCNCSQNHAEEQANQLSLYTYIDLPNVRALNETDESNVKGIFKPEEPGKHSSEPQIYVESDADEQLMIHIPFTGNVKIKSISIYSEHGASSPSRLMAFVNQPALDFETAIESLSAQTFELSEQELNEPLVYPTKLTKFTNVAHLTLLFDANYGADTTKIFYLGFKGDFTPFTREAILNTVYELNANPKNIKLPMSSDSLQRSIQ